ncbi:hypothetical protein ACT4UV_05395 [Acinetobacter baumannii]
MSLLSACSNNVLNAEAPRAAQGQQDLESRPLVLSTSKEWNRLLIATQLKRRNS